jgi:hypothetical protein
MSQRAPSIIWALTVATQEFYSEAATASQFNEAESRDKDPPRIIANLDVADPSKLQITAACDLPAFLRHTPAPPAPSTCRAYNNNIISIFILLRCAYTVAIPRDGCDGS